MVKGFLCFGAALASVVAADSKPLAKKSKNSTDKPNIILIMVDDMGYSDIGCFGSEIPTPNLDRLAQSGIRYTNFYTTARSCPTRASLLTGLYQHDAGIGGMSEDGGEMNKERSVHDFGTYGYRGALNRNCVTIAEVLKTEGYHTYMVGKWHVGLIGREKWPLQRGFDRYYGILAGASSYLKPQGGRGLTLDNTQIPPPSQPYYTTDQFTDYALKFISSHEKGEPFFLYVAYNAPHWPLHAKQEDIDKFAGKYDQGWEKTRQARFDKMVELGIVDEDWGLGEWENRSWDQLTHEQQAKSSLRMSVYAAQVHCMDYNVGRIIKYLEDTDQIDNTMILFFSDNGACAEPGNEMGFGNAEINDPDSWVDPSYGKPWAQVSNTPFRKYKVRAYEGGISTSFIMSYPKKTKKYAGEIRRNVAFLPDIMATFIDISGATYPETFHDGQKIHPLAGTSMMPTVSDPKKELHEYIFGEHEKNRFARWKQWKAVRDQTSKRWELYDVVADRSERHDLAAQHPEILEQLVEKWNEWAAAHNVFPRHPGGGVEE